MKILVLSDSHGAVSPMEQAVEQTSPDLILHLGGTAGGTGNGSMTGFLHPPGTGSGNCHFGPTGGTAAGAAGSVFSLCHGHTYGVKQSHW